jgi:hypothetical protein
LRAISTLNNLSPRPELVVIPETSSILRCRKSTRMQQSCLCSAGAIRGNSWQTRSTSISAKRFPIPPMGLDILLIDSTVAGAPHGKLDAPTLSWLDESLGASTTLPALLFLHHPPFDRNCVQGRPRGSETQTGLPQFLDATRAYC